MTFSQIVDLVILVVKIIILIVKTTRAKKEPVGSDPKGSEPTSNLHRVLVAVKELYASLIGPQAVITIVVDQARLRVTWMLASRQLVV